MKRRDLFGGPFLKTPLGKATAPARWDPELKTRISRLSLAIARADALAEIARAKLFRGTRGFLSEDDRTQLATIEPESRALLEKFIRVETNTIALAVSAIAPHAGGSGLVRIGTDSAFGSVLVGADAAALFIAAEGAEPSRDPTSAIPSVWHYLLYVRESRGPA